MNVVKKSEPTTQTPAKYTAPAWNPFRAMRELAAWDPFAQMSTLLPAHEAGFNPDFEVKETPEGYAFRADLPGIKEKDLEISTTGNRLTISGSREAEKKNESDKYFVYECSYGSFTGSFTLPEGIDTDKIVAELKDGVLRVLVPKRPEVQPRKVAVKT